MPETEFTPQNLSEKTLRYGYWFVTHKLLIKKIIIIIIILFDAVTIGWSGWVWFSSYVLEVESDKQAAAENATSVLNSSFRSGTASPLIIGNAQMFTVGDKVDFSAEVKNPNVSYRADFTYRFIVGDKATAERTGFVLPNDGKDIMALGEKVVGSPPTVVFEITNIAWKRVDRHQIPDYQKFSSDRLNFNITDIKFVPEGTAAPTLSVVKTGATGKTTFTFKNNTGFGYKAIKFSILLYRGPALAAVNSITIADVRAGDTRLVEASWFQPLQAISDTRIIPEVDIMNDAVYLR